ncbi:MAG: hypothetical protein R6U50_09585 [Desulfobacterales bacterium]
MRIDPNPIYRKIIVPWYDSESACFATILSMVPVMLFGISGILISRDPAQYRSPGWIAFLLTGLSGYVIISVSLRLLGRHLKR